jgi:hypothetical protein
MNLSKPRRLFIGAFSSLILVIAPAYSHADQLEEHDSLVQKYIADQHANPLVADCAAHAVFVVSTSNYYDHADFADNALDDQHATVQPWNDAFDNGKQRIKVDTIVTVTGQGIRKSAQGTPDALTFKCGFLDNKLLAFSYNDPQANTAGTAHGKRRGKSTRGTRGHGTTHATHGAKPASAAKGKPAHPAASTAKSSSTAKKTPPKPATASTN